MLAGEHLSAGRAHRALYHRCADDGDQPDRRNPDLKQWAGDFGDQAYPYAESAPGPFGAAGSDWFFDGDGILNRKMSP